MRSPVPIRRWAMGAALSLALPIASNAQQDPMYTMYMWNMMAIDPAYAGSADVLNVAVLSRLQWAGIEGAPVTHCLTGHAPVNQRTLGLGLDIARDQIGRNSTTSFFADLAYRIHVSNSSRLAFGLKAGANHTQAVNTRVENVDVNDPTFASDISGKLRPNFGFGLYLWSKRGYLGLSAPKLLRSRIVAASQGSTMSLTEESLHAFFTAGYVFRMGGVKFKSALMVKASEGAPLSGDLSANFFFMDRLCLGAAYRTGDSFSGILSVQVTDQWRIGYAYDLGTSALASRSNGSHEAMLAYAPVFNRDRIRSPRYF